MIPVNTLLEESKCYLCLGISQAEALELALLNRIAEGGGVLVYEASVTQQNTDPPVSVVLKNTLGGTPVWTRTGPGVYRLTLAGAFPQSRTLLMCSPLPVGDTDVSFEIAGLSVGDGLNFVTLIVASADIAGGTWNGMAYSDNVFPNNSLYVQIKVYP